MKHVKIMHFRFRGGDGVLPRGGVTVAIDKLNKRWAAAWCAPEDNFCRKTGRELALKRLQEQNGYCYEIEPDDDIATICTKAISGAPEAWQRHIRRWLQNKIVQATLSCGRNYEFDFRLQPCESRSRPYLAITWVGPFVEVTHAQPH